MPKDGRTSKCSRPTFAGIGGSKLNSTGDICIGSFVAFKTNTGRRRVGRLLSIDQVSSRMKVIYFDHRMQEIWVSGNNVKRLAQTGTIEICVGDMVLAYRDLQMRQAKITKLTKPDSLDVVFDDGFQVTTSKNEIQIPGELNMKKLLNTGSYEAEEEADTSTTDKMPQVRLSSRKRSAVSRLSDGKDEPIHGPSMKTTKLNSNMKPQSPAGSCSGMIFSIAVNALECAQTTWLEDETQPAGTRAHPEDAKGPSPEDVLVVIERLSPKIVNHYLGVKAEPEEAQEYQHVELTHTRKCRKLQLWTKNSKPLSQPWNVWSGGIIVPKIEPVEHLNMTDCRETECFESVWGIVELVCLDLENSLNDELQMGMTTLLNVSLHAGFRPQNVLSSIVGKKFEDGEAIITAVESCVQDLLDAIVVADQHEVLKDDTADDIVSHITTTDLCVLSSNQNGVADVSVIECGENGCDSDDSRATMEYELEKNDELRISNGIDYSVNDHGEGDVLNENAMNAYHQKLPGKVGVTSGSRQCIHPTPVMVESHLSYNLSAVDSRPSSTTDSNEIYPCPYDGCLRTFGREDLLKTHIKYCHDSFNDSLSSTVASDAFGMDGACSETGSELSRFLESRALPRTPYFVVNCVCEDETFTQQMIQCRVCFCWQHCECIGVLLQSGDNQSLLRCNFCDKAYRKSRRRKGLMSYMHSLDSATTVRIARDRTLYCAVDCMKATVQLNCEYKRIMSNANNPVPSQPVGCDSNGVLLDMIAVISEVACESDKACFLERYLVRSLRKQAPYGKTGFELKQLFESIEQLSNRISDAERKTEIMSLSKDCLRKRVFSLRRRM